MKIAYAEIINVNARAFIAKVMQVSEHLGIHPSWLMIVIRIESNFNRKAINPYSGAVGLIQWIPKFVAPLLKINQVNTRLIQHRIQNMTGVEQLELIGQFLSPYRGKMKDVYQTYLAVFYPKALGKLDDYIIGKRYAKGMLGQAYEWNKYLDEKYGNNDGEITVTDIKKFVNNFVPENCDMAFNATKSNVRKICQTCGQQLPG